LTCSPSNDASFQPDVHDRFAPLRRVIRFAAMRITLARRLLALGLKISLPPILLDLASMPVCVMGWGGHWRCPFTLLLPAKGTCFPPDAHDRFGLLRQTFPFRAHARKLGPAVGEGGVEDFSPSYPLHIPHCSRRV
jgi:hypothetical protein